MSLQALYDQYGSLTNKQRKLFDYVMANVDSVCYITLRELSQNVGMAEVSVLRFCRALGFDGFLDLKNACRRHAHEQTRAQLQNAFLLERPDPALYSDETATFGHILSLETQNVQALFDTLDGRTLFQCARELLTADEVFVFGHDGCKIFADYCSHRLNYLRIKASSIQLINHNTVKMHLSRIKKNDCAIFFSFPAYYLPIRNIVRYAESRGARIVTIADSPKAPAVTEGGHNFYCKTDTKSFFNSFTTPISLISMLTSCVAAELGDRLDEILAEETRVNRFIDGDETSQAGELFR